MVRLDRARAARLLAWSGLAVLVVALVLTDALAPDGSTEALLSWAISLVPILMACGASYMTFRRVMGEERRFWLLMTLATALLFVSESFWAYSVVFVDPLGPRLPHPFELLQLGAALVFVAMVVSLTRFGSEPLAVRARFYVDILLGMVVGFVAAYRWLIVPLFEGIPRHSTGLLLVGSAYPVLGVTLLAGTFGVLLGLKAHRWRPWERLFAASLTVYTAGILAWPWWYVSLQSAAEPLTIGLLVNYLFTAGFYFLFIAAVYRLTERSGRPVPRSVPAPLGRWPWASPVYLGVMVLCVPLLAWASATATGSADARVYLGSAVVLASLLGVRSWLSTLEGTYLFASSVTDPVTGLANRRAFEAVLPVTIASRGEGDLAVIAFDVDGFGRLNEVGGRNEGDRVLREVAEVLERTLASRARLFRLGGDDIVALLPAADAAQAVELAEMSGCEVERTVQSGAMAVSVSSGVASAPAHAREGEDLVRKAMFAQQWARSAGGARTRVYDEAEGHLLDPDERFARIRRGDHLSTVRALASAVDARDAHAPEHSRIVARYVVALARELGMSEKRVALLETAALLHDIGKLGVDDSVLSTPYPFTQAQRDRIEEHPVFAERILRSAGIDEILPWIRHHHERWDGGGYPDGRSGEEIPLEARIIGIADSYEVMTSGRPWRALMDHRAALRHIELEGGTHFDPTVAATFVRLMWDSDPSGGKMSRAVPFAPRSAE